MKTIRSTVQRHPFLVFIFFAYILVAGSIPVALSAPDLLPLLLSLWPALVAIVLAGLIEGSHGIKTLLAALVQWRVRPVWYAAALGIPILGTTLILVSAIILGSPTAKNIGSLSVFLFLISYIFNAFEEIGWRGFVLPRLLKNHSPLAASLIVGIFWSVFHLPLHLPGNWYAQLPVIPTILILIAYSVIATWIFVNTKGSILMTLLFHGTVNSFTPLISGVELVQAWWLRAFVFMAIALVIVLLAGRKFSQKI